MDELQLGASTPTIAKPTVNHPDWPKEKPAENRCSSDVVNPAHYQGDYVMRIIEDFGLDFLDGQVIKYILRAGHKPGESTIIDHKKALWYLERKIRNMEI